MLNNLLEPAPPKNYKKIDEFLSRSAQPTQENFIWLKTTQGVTDVINFRTMFMPAINFDEEEVLKKMGVNYLKLPISGEQLLQKSILEEKLLIFFDAIEQIKKETGRKAHLHCKAGADRTGFFSLAYKFVYEIGTLEQNITEMLKMGHNKLLYPDLIRYAELILKKKKV